jgi:hypothetical protein
MTKKYTKPALGLVTVLMAFSLFTSTAKADFMANNLIDDGLFNNANVMTAAQIDAFLNNNFPNSCISTKKGFSSSVPAGYSLSTNYVYGANVSAGQVIATAAQAYGLNPQVILSTLEKEENLVTGSQGCSGLRYASAMGNDCPDNLTSSNYTYTNGTDAGTLRTPLYYNNGTPVNSVTGTCVNTNLAAGFSEQIITATWKLKFWQQHAIGNYNWAVIIPGWDNSDDIGRCYTGPMTGGSYQRGSSSACNQVTFYDGYTIIDSTSVHLDNGATAALYYYTPHFHGNQLFVSVFESWFGSTNGEGYVLATSFKDNGDARQWVVYRGIRQLVSDTDMLQAWGLNKLIPLQWSGTYLGSFPTAPQSLTRLFRPSGSLDVYFVDGGNSYRVTSPDMLKAWNFNPAAIMDIPIYLGRVPINSGNLTYSIKDINGNVYYIDGGSKRLYANATVQAAWEPSGTSHQTISLTYLSMMGSGPNITDSKASYNGQYYVMSNGQTFMTVDPNIADEWSINNTTSSLLVPISPGFKLLYMLTRFARSAYPSDLRLFAIEKGTLYYLSPDQAANLGLISSTPVMTVVPEAITASISPWTSVMVKDANGKPYVIDGGTKRPFPNQATVDYWTNNGAINTLQVTNGFLNLLPNNDYIERGIRSSAPTYSVEGLTKRWILSPSSAALYVPIQPVSTALINILPDGTNIP